ncbi:SOS response-associated peptidase [Pseudaminobacter salicylatoxidans]|uniref:SOS response-associated peptidase n=1 Tax=Pseudaminobacter salicylatoxidans TaxID=93369 RepID=UPI0002F48B8E|nr:SOS response-associated peptidase [Pseudaminobacter salicylatoxidans]
MCGRFTRFHTWPDIHRMYRLTDSERGRNTEARYNIAPTEGVLFVTAGDGDFQSVRTGIWWLTPFWAKERPKFPTFNARSEEAADKPAFRDAFRQKRCLIPADGFYEWTKNAEDGGKDPWFIHLPGDQPFSFAGLWAHNSALDITSCTILTAAAQEPMRQLHDRQPIILAPDAYDSWLDPATSVADAKKLLKQDLDGDLQFHRVGREVNSTRNGTDHSRLIGPLNPL